MNCNTEYCTGNAIKGEKKCSKCRQRRYRERNKIASAYQRLKDHARERFIEFSITKDYWKKFCAITNYHNLKGTGKLDMCIDRIIVTLGYTDYNIRMITNEENGKKQHKEDRAERTRSIAEKYKSEGAPF